DGVEDRGLGPQRPTRRRGDDPDDLGVHDTAPRDARKHQGAGWGVEARSDCGQGGKVQRCRRPRGQRGSGDLLRGSCECAAEVVAIFDQLLQLRYPIERIRTVDNYPGADDELSMEDNNQPDSPRYYKLLHTALITRRTP